MPISSTSPTPIIENPFHHHPNHDRHRRRESVSLMGSFQKAVFYGGAAFLFLNVMVVLRLHFPSTDSMNATSGNGNLPLQQHQKPKEATTANSNNNKQQLQCHFRQYPPRRYYGLQKLEQPDFLTTVDYVYGKYPIMVLPDSSIVNYHDQGKLCVDQSEWLPPNKLDRTIELPFADGTNPSILSLDRLTTSYSDLVESWRQLGGAYIATICMTDSQCSYQDTPQEIQLFKLSRDKKPIVVQTLLLILDQSFRTLLQTTIYLERDAPWGRKFKKAYPDNQGGGFERKAFAMDDARLFIHLNQLWVSYREGPSFGYEQQVLNEVHLSYNANANSNKLSAIIKASESASFCCGRNMALMEHLDDPTQLQSLTWADPVTVIDVDDGRKPTAAPIQSLSDPKQEEQEAQQRRRRLADAIPQQQQQASPLTTKPKKSHFHGTNAFMVYLPKSQEFLGIGHFHRPPGRDAFNPYARFGHHYTHTFFTISSQPPFRLMRLSQEFVLPSKSKILQDDDAEIIQFLSGLDVVTLAEREYAVIAYGVNDCEGAAVYLEMDRINELLLPVEAGKEVVDLMMPLESKKS